MRISWHSYIGAIFTASVTARAGARRHAFSLRIEPSPPPTSSPLTNMFPRGEAGGIVLAARCVRSVPSMRAHHRCRPPPLHPCPPPLLLCTHTGTHSKSSIRVSTPINTMDQQVFEKPSGVEEHPLNLARPRSGTVRLGLGLARPRLGMARPRLGMGGPGSGRGGRGAGGEGRTALAVERPTTVVKHATSFDSPARLISA